MTSITTRTRYGLRALIYIALNSSNQPVTIHSISKAKKISLKYLENIFKLLKQSGIVTSTRGSEGGYLLSRNPEEISLLEIFTALEGPLILSKCIDDENYCENSDKCKPHLFWEELQNNIKDFLETKTLFYVINNYDNGRKEI